MNDLFTPLGIAGLAQVVKEGYPDYTAWDPVSCFARTIPAHIRWQAEAPIL